jgi:hypothetical protein
MTVQLNIEYAKKARDKGIEQAVKHADQVFDKWSDKCYGLFKDFVKANPQPFQMETFRHSIVGLLDEPPHKRAFGSIAVRAVRSGLIKRVGTAPVKNVKAHMAFSTVWIRT